MALFDQIGAEMWEVARPGVKWQEEASSKKAQKGN